jgi:hypothetical protein
MTTTKKTALKIVSAFPISAESTNVPSTIGTAPQARPPQQCSLAPGELVQCR